MMRRVVVEVAGVSRVKGQMLSNVRWKLLDVVRLDNLLAYIGRGTSVPGLFPTRDLRAK